MSSKKNKHKRNTNYENNNSYKARRNKQNNQNEINQQGNNEQTPNTCRGRITNSQAIDLADSTLEILEKGYYLLPTSHKQIQLHRQIESSCDRTVLYAPDFKHDDPQIVYPDQDAPEFIILHNTTLEAAQNFASIDQKSIAVLNFASAKKPGGGFITGARAQEESLARSSALYSTLILPKVQSYYGLNLKDKTCVYTHNIIYSPDVPVFRVDEGDLLDPPYLVSFITAPAVNAGVARKRIERYDREETIERLMSERADRILSIALKHEHDTIILGAWGCGVFRNSPRFVAEMFHKLATGKFCKSFKRIVFAINDETTYNLFVDVFERFKTEKKDDVSLTLNEEH